MTSREMEEHIMALIAKQTELEDRIEQLEDLVFEDVILVEEPPPDTSGFN